MDFPIMDSTLEPLFLSRQAIFNAHGNAWGCRISHFGAERPVLDNIFAAAARMVVDGVMVLDRESGRAGNIVIPIPGKLVRKQAAMALPAEAAVIEIRGEEHPDGRILAACRGLKQEGFRLAFPWFERLYMYDHLLDLADFVVMDAAEVTAYGMERMAWEKDRYGLDILMAGVAEADQYERGRRLGGDYFCGGFFSRPVLVEGRKLTTAQMTRLRIIREIHRQDMDMEQVGQLVMADSALCYRLLGYINSAWFGLAEKVDNVSEALRLLGAKRLKHWLLLVVLADVAPTETGEELLFLAAMRGRFFELAARSMAVPPHTPEQMFLLGSFSMLESMLGIPFAEFAAQLPLDPPLDEALRDKAGPLYVWIRLARALEDGRWNEAVELLAVTGLAHATAATCHFQAFAWANGMLKTPRKAPDRAG